ncbi:hypothetical protein HYX04_02380 [Candidatus Woesearchaeota archaeon]|nr:hypothetical protein [Candidatus Woesearchaeota archaeon]
MEKKNWLILAIITGIVGSFYEFVPRKTIKSIADFLLFDVNVMGHRIRHNDLILLGAVLLIISFVSFYKVYKLGRNSKIIKKE